MRSEKLRNKILLLAAVLSLISTGVRAQVIGDEFIFLESDSRAPSTDDSKYPKSKDGLFEAQGFGKDFSKRPVIVPKSEIEPKVEERLPAALPDLPPAPPSSVPDKKSKKKDKKSKKSKKEVPPSDMPVLEPLPEMDSSSATEPEFLEKVGTSKNSSKTNVSRDTAQTAPTTDTITDPKAKKDLKTGPASVPTPNLLADPIVNSESSSSGDTNKNLKTNAVNGKPSEKTSIDTSAAQSADPSKGGVTNASGVTPESMGTPVNSSPAVQPILDSQSAQDEELQKAKAKLADKSKKKGESEETVPVKSEEELKNELQLQRRVDVFYEGRVRFKNGAAIWATEDAGSVSPKLEITAPEFVDLSQETIRFMVFSNYFSFIKRWELRIYRMNAVYGQEEVALLKGGRSSLYNIEYQVPKDKFKDGDTLYYQLKVFQDEKVYDVVRSKMLTFIKRVDNQDLRQQDDKIKSTALLKIWGENAIEFQNIPIQGSRVRLVGSNIPIDYVLNYRGQNVQVDSNGTFVIEEHFPVGEHKIQIEITDQKTEEVFKVPFTVTVTGDYFFYVAMADFRVGENKLSQKVVGVDNSNEFGETFLDGRLAFYLKGKVQGKYLITAQMDTTEGPIENMFDGLHRKNAESLFRRLDPDRYYPVYGDNSNTTEGAPSAGKLFVKIEADQSYLMWGNDNTDMTRTWLSQYNRTLYGAHFKHRSRVSTKFAQRKTNINAFASEPETLMGHNEFLGTGGVQYILRHNDVVQGSEKVQIEIRDRDSGIMKKQATLKPFQDYQFDYLAGRIILSAPLSTFAGVSDTQIVDNNTVGGDLYYLIADYEYNASGADLDQASYGASGEHWLNDYISVGGTYVSEKRAGGEYLLKGVDTSLRVGKDSYIKVERSETENVQSLDNFTSEDGGLSFVQKPQTILAAGQAAQAWVVESQFHLTDFAKTEGDAILSTWYRDFEAGFSTARLQAQNDMVEYGYNLDYRFMGRNILKSKATSLEETGVRKEDMYLVSLGREFSTGSTVSVEYRQDKIQNLTTLAEGRGDVVGALINQKVTPAINIYGKAQTSLEEEGIYTSNDRWAVGTKFRMGAKWDGLAEYSDGDRGEGSVVGVGYNIDGSHKVYGNFDKSIDSTTGVVSNGLTLGQRKRFDSGYSLTAENGFDTVGDNAGVKQLYGLDYNLNRVLTMGASVQYGDLENRLTGAFTSKDAVSANVTYTKNQEMFASTKVSYVNQRGVINLDQFLVTNSLRFITSPAHTFSLKADYSFSEDPNFADPLAKYFEGNLGYSYRPIKNNRMNTFFRYTFLYDLDSQAQVNSRTDQKVNILSGETSYDITRRWELGGRLAQKIGSERIIRGSGPWIDATLTFAQIRARYHLIKKWDGVFELRGISVRENKDLQAGTLVGLDYHLGENLKLGGGFNFTRFNDDLTNFNYDNYGWFINLIGKM